MSLHRYWFEFEIQKDKRSPAGVSLGCGITAYSYDDALQLLHQLVFKGEQVPQIRTSLEDVDISSLDPNHVQPNMGVPTIRGVWFPQGFESN